MRTHRFLVPTLALAALLLMLPVVAFAQPGPGGGCPTCPGHGDGFGPHGGGHHGRGHHGPGHHGFGGRGFGGPGLDGLRGERMMFMLHGLDLSDAQREQIRGILDGEREGAEARHEALRDAHKSLHQLAMAETYDAAAAKAAADTIGRLMAEMAENRARVGNSIYQVLTPEQRTEVAERHERRQAHRQERRENRGR